MARRIVEKLMDRAWLETEYAAGKSIGKIAAEAGCSDTAVNNALRRHGIAIRRRGRPGGEARAPRLADREWLMAACSTSTQEEVAAALGVSRRTVGYWVAKHTGEVRPEAGGAGAEAPAQ